MSDPAVDAARRASFLGSCGDGPEDFAEDAAREALKPIRELHRKSPVYNLADDCEICSSDDEDVQEQHERRESMYGDWLCLSSLYGYCCHHCAELSSPENDPPSWPCETASYVYTEEELS